MTPPTKKKGRMSILIPNGDRNIQPLNPPLNSDGTPKLRFETKIGKRIDGTIEKAIFIGGEKLDWSVDASSLMEAMKMGPKFFRAAKQDIQKHFVDSVSEFIGKKVTVEEIQKATKTGWI